MPASQPLPPALRRVALEDEADAGPDAVSPRDFVDNEQVGTAAGAAERALPSGCIRKR